MLEVLTFHSNWFDRIEKIKKSPTMVKIIGLNVKPQSSYTSTPQT